MDYVGKKVKYNFLVPYERFGAYMTALMFNGEQVVISENKSLSSDHMYRLDNGRSYFRAELLIEGVDYT